MRERKKMNLMKKQNNNFAFRVQMKYARDSVVFLFFSKEKLLFTTSMLPLTENQKYEIIFENIFSLFFPNIFCIFYSMDRRVVITTGLEPTSMYPVRLRNCVHRQCIQRL